MKSLLVQDGGREMVWDDLLFIENEARTSVEALCAAVGVSAFVLSGCRVTQTGATVRIGAGIVYLGGQLLRFTATDNLTLPVEIVADSTAVNSDDRRYEDGSSRPGAQQVFAIARAATATPVSKIQIADLTGGLTYAQATFEGKADKTQPAWQALALGAVVSAANGLPPQYVRTTSSLVLLRGALLFTLPAPSGGGSGYLTLAVLPPEARPDQAVQVSVQESFDLFGESVVRRIFILPDGRIELNWPSNAVQGSPNYQGYGCRIAFDGITFLAPA